MVIKTTNINEIPPKIFVINFFLYFSGLQVNRVIRKSVLSSFTSCVVYVCISSGDASTRRNTQYGLHLHAVSWLQNQNNR